MRLVAICPDRQRRSGFFFRLLLLFWLGAGIAAPGVVAGDRTASSTIEDRFPQVARAYYVELDGRALWGSGVELAMPPASLTKMMTAHLVARAGDLEQTVTVSAQAAAMTGARLGLRAGDRSTRRDLLQAMLVGSGNDACVALAESLAGSEPAFVAEMNAEAQRLQLLDTHFANACGFDAPDHRSSIRDLLVLTRLLLADPTLAPTVALAQVSVQVNGKRRLVKSSNALLGRLPGAIGVKTGFTRQAGKCVIALTERNGVQVLAVFLNAPDRWWDLAAIIELAYREARSRAATPS